MKKLLLLFSILGFLSKSSSFGQITIRQIKPSDTDSSITTFNEDSHYVYTNSEVVSKNILVVHLPGSFGEPKRATLFGTLAANLGFHSIGLMYPNIPTVGSFCSNSPNNSCFEEVRREIVEGKDYSTELVINQQESILNRLQQLLIYLHQNFPQEKWGQYLDTNGQLIFNQMIFSGHSQGGGHAALIAKFFPIKRALCFSSPKDWMNVTNAPPSWLSTDDWQTPSKNLFCFNHTLDEHTNRQLEIWDSLGLEQYGAPINVDNTSPPYQYTRQLTTSYSVPAGDDHACTIQDNKTPKVNGNPVFSTVWTYMLTNQLTMGTSLPIKEQGSSQLLLKPNPAETIVNIESTTNLLLVNIYDQLGNLVFTKSSSDGINQLDFSAFSSGIYLIYASDHLHIYTGKIVKH